MLYVQCENRPITLIAHDLGGIVVKKVSIPPQIFPGSNTDEVHNYRL